MLVNIIKMTIMILEKKRETMYSYTEAVNYIEEIPKFSKKTTHDNLKQILNEIAVNEDTFKIIHVAGTNGKGSVCSYVTGILCECGKNVGTFISPHLITTRERFIINKKIVSEEEFVQAFDVIKGVVDRLEGAGIVHPSYFEFLFLIGMYIFKKREVEYVVLEVGLGGRLDATNVFDKVLLSIITSISLDHMEILGSTIEEIAAEKAGIIKENVPVVYLDNNDTVSRIIEEKAKERHAKAYKVTTNDTKILKKSLKNIDFYFDNMYYKEGMFSVPSMAIYQIANSIVAITAIAVISKLLNEVISYEQVRDGLAKVVWQGRMERVLDDVIIDGAHNEDGIAAFITTCQSIMETQSLSLLFSAVKEKDYTQMIKEICEGVRFNNITVTNIYGKRNLDANVIADVFRKYAKGTKVTVIDEPTKAFDEALKGKCEEDILMCAGSLYLVGMLKEHIEKNYKND